MKRAIRLLCFSLIFVLFVGVSYAQDKTKEWYDQNAASKAFELGNALMEQQKYPEALARYKEAFAILPNEPSVLFNGGLAAYRSKDFVTAVDWWKRLKAINPEDWHLRAKLIQGYQALGKLSERDAERKELFEMWKSGKPAELKQEFEYCRDQFEVNGKRVMAFEHFELKGDRALRYVFSILNEAGNHEDWRISLGSYDLTNSIWRETTKPTPKKGERLFHLDGYFKGGHATYGMYSPEPTFDQVRSKVIQILEGQAKPQSESHFEAKPKP